MTNWNASSTKKNVLPKNTKVEYALRGMTQPLGVAEYQTNKMIEELKSELPSIDDLESTLNKDTLGL